MKTDQWEDIERFGEQAAADVHYAPAYRAGVIGGSAMTAALMSVDGAIVYQGWINVLTDTSGNVTGWDVGTALFLAGSTVAAISYGLHMGTAGLFRNHRAALAFALGVGSLMVVTAGPLIDLATSGVIGNGLIEAETGNGAGQEWTYIGAKLLRFPVYVIAALGAAQGMRAVAWGLKGLRRIKRRKREVSVVADADFQRTEVHRRIEDMPKRERKHRSDLVFEFTSGMARRGWALADAIDHYLDRKIKVLSKAEWDQLVTRNHHARLPQTPEIAALIDDEFSRLDPLPVLPADAANLTPTARRKLAHYSRWLRENCTPESIEKRLGALSNNNIN